MNIGEWIKEFPAAITVSNDEGIIVEMNDRACKNFEKYGGKKLIGKNLLDIHPEPARSKLAEMMGKRVSNAYTIEKNGIKKLIYQSPWYQEGIYAGYVEWSVEIPAEMPHFVRTPPDAV
ncbi:MAG TPA: PAS domain S-box protein [Patescibacteria group bacterium]|nr:PAS domain S-box protein [Patescibacteria group bacterium]